VTVGEIIAAAEKASSVLKILEPVANEVATWLEGGAEPSYIANLPSELQSVAALERAKYRARKSERP
jgi:hypothetical protein